MKDHVLAQAEDIKKKIEAVQRDIRYADGSRACFACVNNDNTFKLYSFTKEEEDEQHKLIMVMLGRKLAALRKQFDEL